jgi:hydroxyacylglutathione hydrolase
LRLARVGYENVAGVLNGGMEAWKAAGKDIDTVNSVSAVDFVTNLKGSDTVLDVRKPGEVESGMIENAQHICLSDLQSRMDSLDKNANYLVHCAGGYRSMMAVSIMKRKGFRHLTNVLGGMGKIKETGIKLVHPVIV